MDASRTHEATYEQSLWSWVVFGAVVLALAVAIIVWQGAADDGIVVRAPAPAQGQVDPVTKDDFLRGRGLVDAQVGATGDTAFADAATGIREGGVYAGTIPPGTPDSFTGVRESGTYYDEAVVATPRHGLCATKAGC